MNEEPATVDAVAPDKSGRFAYLLIAGDFSRSDSGARRGVGVVRHICEEFSTNGLEALRASGSSIPVRSWVLDRWDKLGLRVLLHGEADVTSRRNHA